MIWIAVPIGLVTRQFEYNLLIHPDAADIAMAAVCWLWGRCFS